MSSALGSKVAFKRLAISRDTGRITLQTRSAGKIYETMADDVNIFLTEFTGIMLPAIAVVRRKKRHPPTASLSISSSSHSSSALSSSLAVLAKALDDSVNFFGSR